MLCAHKRTFAMLIYLIRHALADYTTGVPYHIAPGPGLSETGYAEASAIVPLLVHCGIERVMSSPMRRCLQTAEPLCAAIGLEPLIDDDLGEMATWRGTACDGSAHAQGSTGAGRCEAPSPLSPTLRQSNN